MEGPCIDEVVYARYRVVVLSGHKHDDSLVNGVRKTSKILHMGYAPWLRGGSERESNHNTQTQYRTLDTPCAFLRCREALYSLQCDR